MKKFFLFVCTLVTALVLPICAQAADAGLFTHTLSRDLTVSELADYYELDGELLAAMNDLEPTQQLSVGSRVRIPLEPRQTLAVEKDDTLWQLAQRYQVDVDQLMEQNDLVSSDQLISGQQLTVALVEEQTSFASAEEIRECLAIASRGQSMNFIWPLKGRITSRFGKRSSGYHHGLDIAAENGSAIKAARAGRVTQAGWLSGIYGYGVKIDHGNGLSTLYAHASAITVEPGQAVKQGETVALVGVSGRTSGPHLHFEVRTDGQTVDPLHYLP